MAYIDINNAAEIAGKSIQTIRRMIKSKKVKYKQQRTPQGFNYLIDEDSILGRTARSASVKQAAQSKATIQPRIASNQPSSQTPTHDDAMTNQETSQPSNQDYAEDVRLPKSSKNNDLAGFHQEVAKFGSTIDKLIDQNERDKKSFFQLIETFQNRIAVLENQIKMLEAPKPKWYHLWK